MKVKKIFLANGVEVHACDELEADDMLWVSEGAPFWKEIGEPTLETIHVSVLGSGGVGKR